MVRSRPLNAYMAGHMAGWTVLNIAADLGPEAWLGTSTGFVIALCWWLAAIDSDLKVERLLLQLRRSRLDNEWLIAIVRGRLRRQQEPTHRIVPPARTPARNVAPYSAPDDRS